MKILLATPDFLKTVPMCEYASSALKQLGHQIISFNCRPDIRDKAKRKLLKQDDGYKYLNKKLEKLILKHEPDLFLTIYGFNISLETLDFIKEKRIPSVCWWLNDPFQIERSLEKANSYDFLFTNDPGSISAYKKAGMDNVYYLPTACEPSVHHQNKYPSEIKTDVCFAGDWCKIREELLNQVDQAGLNYRIYGPWKKKLSKNSILLKNIHNGFFSPAQMRQFFNQANVVLNIHSWYGNYNTGTNPRLFEAAGCGALQLVDNKNEISGLFEPDEEIFIYEKIEQVPEKIEQILAIPKQRQNEIRLNAHKRAYSEHTYLKRMENLIYKVFA